MTETFMHDVSPQRICVVCGKTKNDLTLEERVKAFKDHFDGYSFSEEEILEMAKDGGHNYFSPS